MTENEIAKIIVDAAYKIHTRLGPGLLGLGGAVDEEGLARRQLAGRGEAAAGSAEGAASKR